MESGVVGGMVAAAGMCWRVAGDAGIFPRPGSMRNRMLRAGTLTGHPSPSVHQPATPGALAAATRRCV
ncbi:hypothetical protein ACINB_13430 [Acidovorax sp. NB1]|nr:hypothetical protein ACINB_13430 [Acidovorax sp. NB1]